MPPKITDSSRPAGGVLSGNYVKRLPTGRASTPLEISEEDFVRIYLTEACTASQARLRYGISQRKYFETRKKYYAKYAEELTQLKRARYAASKYGNKYGERVAPATVLDAVLLEKELRTGTSLTEIAVRMGTSRWFVRQNIEYHRLQHVVHEALPVFIGKHNSELLDQLDNICPGIRQTAAGAYKDPDTFFASVYAAHQSVLELQDFIAKMAKAYGRRLNREGAAGTPYVFSKNPHENRLAMGLEARGLPYTRCVPVAGTRKTVDFLVDGLVFVEVDGEYHNTPEGKRRDAWKQACLNRPLVRATTRTVTKDLSSVLDVITQLRDSQLSSASNLRESPLFTTSQSKKITVTRL
jgi:very-short-patch-repair endonuclease